MRWHAEDPTPLITSYYTRTDYNGGVAVDISGPVPRPRHDDLRRAPGSQRRRARPHRTQPRPIDRRVIGAVRSPGAGDTARRRCRTPVFRAARRLLRRRGTCLVQRVAELHESSRRTRSRFFSAGYTDLGRLWHVTGVPATVPTETRTVPSGSVPLQQSPTERVYGGAVLTCSPQRPGTPVVVGADIAELVASRSGLIVGATDA